MSRRPSVDARLDAVSLEDLATLLLVGSAQAHDQRQLHVQVVAGGDDPFRHLIAARYAAEHVDYDALDLRVHEDHRQGILDHLGLRPAADVTEVGGPAARTLHEVQRAHAQSGAVADDPDVAVERNIGEAALFGFDLVRVPLDQSAVFLLEVLVAPGGVVIDLELGVAGDHVALLGDDKRVDLGGQGVIVGNRAIELFDHGHQRTREVAQPRIENQLRQFEVERSSPRIRIQPGDRIGRIIGHLLDVHASFRGEHQDVGARVAVDREAQVDLPLDLERRLAVDERDLEALDVHADDLFGGPPRLVGRPGHLDAAGLAPAPHGHLRLDRHRAEPAACPGGLVRSAGDLTGRDGDAKRGEHLFGLVFEELHLTGWGGMGNRGLRCCRCSSRCRRSAGSRGCSERTR